MVLNTELLPLSKALFAIGSSLLLTSAAYEYVRPTDERCRTFFRDAPIISHTCSSHALLNPCVDRYFRDTHHQVPSMSPEWISATENMRDGHVHREASPVDVELNPARRLRDHAKNAKGPDDEYGWMVLSPHGHDPWRAIGSWPT
jgi:hypothetical protein